MVVHSAITGSRSTMAFECVMRWLDTRYPIGDSSTVSCEIMLATGIDRISSPFYRQVTCVSVSAMH